MSFANNNIEERFFSICKDILKDPNCKSNAFIFNKIICTILMIFKNLIIEYTICNVIKHLKHAVKFDNINLYYLKFALIFFYCFFTNL